MRTAADIAGEGAEEAASTVITPYLQRAMYNPDAPNATPEEIAQSALIGSLAAGVLQGGIELPAYLGERADVRNRVTQAAEANLNNPEFVRQGEEQIIRDVNSRINDRTVSPRRDLLRENPLETMLPTWEEVQRRQAGSPVYQSEDNRITLPGEGQQNTASTGETDMGLVPITEQATNRLSSGKNNIIARKTSDIISFVRNALRKKGGPERLYMGTIPDSAANTIRDATGVDVSGYTAILPGDSVQHIFKHHGSDATERTRGQRAVTEDDISLIPQVLSDPDSVLLSSETDVLGRPVLLLTKWIGDTYITAQAVTDGRHALTTNSLWIQKEKNRPAIPDAGTSAGPEGNARSALPQGPSGSIILPGGQEVNRQDAALFAELPTASTYDTEDIYDIYGSGSENLPETAVGANKASPWDLFVASSTEFFPEGANAARDVDVPTTDPQGRRIRKTAATAMGAKAIPDEAIADIQNIVLRGELSYNRVSDKASIDRAVKTIQDKGYQGASEEFRSAVSKGVVSKDIATLGQQLLVNAANAGDGRVMMILNFRSL